jgi:hypothetical protein
MSDNYKQYPQKMVELKATRAVTLHPLREQLEELLIAVTWCEKVWALEERIEKSRNISDRPSGAV